jgi:hypothetical protein
MDSHWSFGHLQPKLWAKEGPGVKLPVWLPTTKSRELTSSWHPNLECNTELKSSRRRLQVWFKPRPDRRSGREATKSQSPGSPKPGQFRDSILGVPGKGAIRVQVQWSGTKNTIGRMVVTPPKPGPWCVMWVRVSPWLVPTPNACRMSSNQLVIWFVSIRMSSWSLSLFLVPTLEFQHAPLPPKCCEPKSVPQLFIKGCNWFQNMCIT